MIKIGQRVVSMQLHINACHRISIENCLPFTSRMMNMRYPTQSLHGVQLRGVYYFIEYIQWITFCLSMLVVRPNREGGGANRYQKTQNSTKRNYNKPKKNN